MQIKLQAMLNGVEALRSAYGAAGVAKVLEACDPEVRERCEYGIAIEWHDAAEFCQFLERAEEVLGTGDGRVAELVGAEGARVHTRSWFKRAAMYVASADYVFRKAAGAWKQFNDQGSIEVLEMSDGRCLLELRDIDVQHELFCETITGWAAVMADRMGLKPSRAKHVECRCRGDARCVWLTEWTPRS